MSTAMHDAPPSAPRPIIRDGAIHTRSPVDGHELPAVAITPADAVGRAVEHARLVQHGWGSRTLAERTQLLLEVAKTTLTRRAEVLDLMRSEVGKFEVDALMSEVLGPLDQVKAWSTVIEKATATEHVSLNPINFPKKSATIQHRARGVVGIIAPWNYPVANLFRSVIPALLCGNAVVVKPSEHATRTESWFLQRFAEALPPGVVQVVVGGRETGVALIEAGIDACIFTGSPGAGRDVGRRCAERLIPFSVELGGKDAAIVLADADLDRTVAGITHWALHNVGQACGAIELCYVDERIADELVARLASAFRRLKIGPGAPGHVDISPLANAQQLAIVEHHVADARAKGATLVTGGQRPPGAPAAGLFYEPTLLDRCSPGMQVVKDETFGPVLAVVRVDGPAEAIRHVNASRYGLTASLWTSDLPRAKRLADELDVGVVTINNHSVTGAMPSLPWSGTRDTGTGVANGALSLHVLTRPRTVLVDSNSAPELYWMPYDANLWQLGNLLSDAQLMKLRQAWKIPFLIKQRVDTVRSFFAKERA